MSHGHFDKLSEKGGKCHKVTLNIFQKYLEAWEEKLNGEKSDW